MDIPRAALAGALFAIVSLGTASVASAQQNGNQNGQGQNNNNQGTRTLIAATPELDSVILLGSGLAGVAGYAALRRRARR